MAWFTSLPAWAQIILLLLLVNPEPFFKIELKRR